MKLRKHLGFSWIENIFVSKQANCSLTTGFSDPQSSRDFPETGPNSETKMEQFSEQTKDQRWEVGTKSKISTLRQTIFSTYERRKRKEQFGSP